jgi:phosphatidylserine decarboxylase
MGFSIYFFSMWTSTKNTLLWKIYDRVWKNKKFTQYSSSIISQDRSFLISPCDAKVIKVWIVSKNGKLIWKHWKTISLWKALWKNHIKTFDWYQYISFYLSPKDRHFFCSPSDGTVWFVHCSNWTARIPWIMALERIWIPTAKKYIERNASISFWLHTDNKLIWMITIGSLNVDRIAFDKDTGDFVSRWEKIGHFLMGSGIILLVPSDFEIQKKVWESVTIGEAIIKKSKVVL